MKTELFKGLEESRKEFNNYQGAAYLYVNLKEMTAWTLVQQDVNYDDVAVLPLVYKDDFETRDDRYGADRLNAIAQTLINFVSQDDFELSDKEDLFEFNEALVDVNYTGNPVYF